MMLKMYQSTLQTDANQVNVSNWETNLGFKGKNKMTLNSQAMKSEKSFRARLKK